MLAHVIFILKILILIPVPLTLWQGIVGLCGLKRPAAVPKTDKKLSFAVVICARNEQAVIGKLIDSLKAQNYPQDKISVFVTADNCSDDTANTARLRGAHVYERFNTLQVGKGYALRWTLQQMKKEGVEYDALCVFDADNIAGADFISNTNDAIIAGADVTQGYRDTKNPYDSYMSSSYCIYWLFLMRFYHLARYNLSLPCMIGGTGWACRYELVKDGWDTKTLTEDVEFSVKQIFAGKNIVPVKKAVFYDEQPDDFKTSVRQRTRWVIGNLQVAREMLPKASDRGLLKTRRQKIAHFDSVTYLILNYCMPIMAILGAAYTLLSDFVTYDSWKITFIEVGIMTAVSFAAVAFLGALVLIIEKKNAAKLWKGILYYPVFLLTMQILAVYALFRKDIEWKPIAHGCKEERIAAVSKAA
jgi:cellulose synthase/poly-beta-1,6-N-acetylglucosamine synthase-like glycosyltransferase